MENNTFVDIHLKEAEHLADLTGIYFDLASARAFARLLKEALDNDQSSYEVIDALSAATIVRYSRPFVSGVRKSLGEDALSVLTTNQRVRHERLRAFRNKHIAHSVNTFEESQPIARYVVERVSLEGIESIECTHRRIFGLSSADIEDVIELSTVLLAYVEKRRDEQKARILELVRRMPVRDVLSRGRKGPTFPDVQRPEIKR
jgi:hypothetical protein